MQDIEETGAGHVLEWSNLKAVASNGNTMLNTQSGSVRSGHLLAVMGPSGAGKSTFLDLLSRRTKSSHADGLITFDGTSDFNMRDIATYVEQDDALLGVLTVAETVTYAAKLSLPANTPKADITRIVSDTLRSMGLSDVANNRIGTPIQRGISGGQKRRVTIASAVVSRPRILLCDEPTSGLDSTTSMKVIASIKTFAKLTDTIVVATIHQPNWETFSLFDEVLFLSGGHCMYQGPIDAVVPYFDSLGYPCPPHSNPADHVIGIVNTDFASSTAPSLPGENGSFNEKNEPAPTTTDAAARTEALATAWLQHGASRVTSSSSSSSTFAKGREGGTAASTSAIAGAAAIRPGSKGAENIVDNGNNTINEKDSASVSLTRSRPDHHHHHHRSHPPSQNPSSSHPFNNDAINRSTGGNVSSLQTQMSRTYLLMTRMTLNYTRNLLAYGVRVGMYAGMGFLLATIWVHLGTKDTKINDRLSVHFFSVAFLGFMSVAGIPSFLEERAVFMRERNNGLYGPGAYVIANSLVNIPFLFLCAVLFSVICYWAIGLHPGGTQFFRFLSFLFIAIYTAEAQSVFVAAVIPIFVAALAIASFMNGLWMCVQGYFIRAVNLPRFWYYTFHWIDYQTFAFNLLVRNDFTGVKFACQEIAGSCHCSYPSSLTPNECAVAGKDVLQSLQIDGFDLGLYAAIMIIIAIVYRILFYFALVWRKK